MNEEVFLDTGAIYALADQNDSDHHLVRAAFRQSQRRFLCHQLILFEAFSLITKRHHKKAALTFVAAVRRAQNVRVVQVEPPVANAAWARCERFADKEWDWIDCVSFELMTRERVRVALTLDHHFVQAGFQTLPD